MTFYEEAHKKSLVHSWSVMSLATSVTWHRLNRLYSGTSQVIVNKSHKEKSNEITATGT